MLTIKGSANNAKTYTTRDGGETWKKLWLVKANKEYEMETEFINPDQLTTGTLVAPVWVDKGGYFKIESLLRLSKSDTHFEIKKYNLGSSAHWDTHSKIKRSYVIKNSRLKF